MRQMLINTTACRLTMKQPSPIICLLQIMQFASATVICCSEATVVYLSMFKECMGAIIKISTDAINDIIWGPGNSVAEQVHRIKQQQQDADIGF